MKPKKGIEGKEETKAFLQGSESILVACCYLTNDSNL